MLCTLRGTDSSVVKAALLNRTIDLLPVAAAGGARGDARRGGALAAATLCCRKLLGGCGGLALGRGSRAGCRAGRRGGSRGGGRAGCRAGSRGGLAGGGALNRNPPGAAAALRRLLRLLRCLLLRPRLLRRDGCGGCSGGGCGGALAVLPEQLLLAGAGGRGSSRLRAASGLQMGVEGRKRGDTGECWGAKDRALHRPGCPAGACSQGRAS